MQDAPKLGYRFHELTLDLDQKKVMRGESPLALPPKVFDTLLILIENRGHLVTKEALMASLWPDTFVEEGNLTFNIKELRRLLGDDARKPRFIETMPRRGYCFIAPVEEWISASGPVDPHAAIMTAPPEAKDQVLPPVLPGDTPAAQPRRYWFAVAIL